MKWTVRLILCLAVLMVLWLPVSAANKKSPLLSPGLSVLAEQAKLIKTGLENNDVSFSADDFERGMNLPVVGSVTLTKLPERSEGVLMLANTEMEAGQTVSRANLSRMTFVFAGEAVQTGSFRFKVDSSGYDIPCEVKLTSRLNRAPKVDGGSLSVETYKNIEVSGKLAAIDPEGDEIRFEVISAPKKGSILFSDAARGVFSYLPKAGVTGADSFSYVAVDSFGNYSESVRVPVMIRKSDKVTALADISNGDLTVAVLSLSERGVMTLSDVDGQYFFHPTDKMTRLEFLVSAMKNVSVGIGVSEETVFADNDLIPVPLRGYVDTAEKQGIPVGKMKNDGTLVFDPNEKITVAEAACILSAMIPDNPSGNVQTQVDVSAVPSWAKDAVEALASVGVYEADDPVNGKNDLTRGDAALLFYRISRVSQDFSSSSLARAMKK